MCKDTEVCRILGVGERAGGEPSHSRAWLRLGRETSQRRERRAPLSRTDLAPVGSRGPGALSGALSSVVRRLPLGPVGLPLPFIRHCEHIPLSVHFLISYLFVSLLIGLLLEQNTQYFQRPSFCEEIRISATSQEQGTKPDPGPRGRDTAGAHRSCLLAWALGLS